MHSITSNCYIHSKDTRITSKISSNTINYLEITAHRKWQWSLPPSSVNMMHHFSPPQCPMWLDPDLQSIPWPHSWSDSLLEPLLEPLLHPLLGSLSEYQSIRRSEDWE